MREPLNPVLYQPRVYLFILTLCTVRNVSGHLNPVFVRHVSTYLSTLSCVHNVSIYLKPVSATCLFMIKIPGGS